MTKTFDSIESLLLNIGELAKCGQFSDCLVLGEGSNTVFVEDYPYAVLLNRIKGIEVVETPSDFLLTVGAGENWHDLVSYCMAKHINGFENLALIPGTVGASPIQNIGAYGVEIEKFVDAVEFLDTTTLTINKFTKTECEFSYRDSIFKRQALNHRIITNVVFKLPKKYRLETAYGPLSKLPSPTAKCIYEEVIAVRKSKLPSPLEFGNAGSFFKNPTIEKSHFERLLSVYPAMPSYPQNDGRLKIPAAWLIDTLGFKGKRIGNIASHINQPLVLVNLGEGNGNDLLTLAREIRDSVQQRFDILLENEVRLMGRKGLVTL